MSYFKPQGLLKTRNNILFEITNKSFLLAGFSKFQEFKYLIKLYKLFHSLNLLIHHWTSWR